MFYLTDPSVQLGKIKKLEECIQVGCTLTAAVAATRCQYWWVCYWPSGTFGLLVLAICHKWPSGTSLLGFTISGLLPKLLMGIFSVRTLMPEGQYQKAAYERRSVPEG